MPALESWRDSAACLGYAPLWDATIDDGGRWTGEQPKARQARHDLAASICERCPVTIQCGTSAKVGRDEGVRGGVILPNLDGSRLVGGQPKKGAGKCGGPWGEKGHRARDEEPCDACVEARRKYDREYQAKRRRRSA